MSLKVENAAGEGVKASPALPKTLSIQEVLPFYVDEELAELVPAIRLYRVDSSESRYYYTLDAAGNPTFYLSMTSFTHSVMPTSKFLIDWRVRLGKEESEDAANTAAAYGTFLHILIAEFMRSRYYDHNETPEVLWDYMKVEGVPSKYFSPWLNDLECDMLSFAQFVYERNVRPLAIEFPLCDPIGLAGMKDLVCEMDWNRRRVIAGVDFKSGRKGFYEGHEAQLHGYKRMWNKMFGGTRYEVTHVFNWSPKAWRGTTPTYNLENQTDSIQGKKLDHYIELFLLDNARTPSKTFTRIKDVLQFGEPVEGRFSVLNVADFITNKHEAYANR